MKADYELVRDYVGVDKPFDVRSTCTNEFLDRSIRMTKYSSELQSGETVDERLCGRRRISTGRLTG